MYLRLPFIPTLIHNKQAQMLKIIILDEKKRKGVLNMAAAVYALSTIIRYAHLTRSTSAGARLSQQCYASLIAYMFTRVLRRCCYDAVAS
jgi:hypothetical protein